MRQPGRRFGQPRFVEKAAGGSEGLLDSLSGRTIAGELDAIAGR